MATESGHWSRNVLRTVVMDYGMVVVLVLLVAAMSVLTLKDQQPTGREAGLSVADVLISRFGTDAGIFICVPGARDDREFAEAVKERLATNTRKPLAVVSGSPAEARQLIEKLIAEGTRIDAIAVTGASASWRIFERFPELSSASFVAPQSGRWPDFLKVSNLTGVANQTAIYAVIAIGMTMVIITGGIDLSVGSLVALSSVAATVLIRDFGGGVDASVTSMAAACVAGICLAAAAGFFNGVMITLAALPSFLVTLAMMLIASGLALRFSNFQSINAVPESFRWLGGGTTAGVPHPILIMVSLYAVAHIIMTRSVFGRVLYAIGGNAEAARLSGIRVQQTKLLVYTISGALAGLGGIMVSSRLNAGDPKYGDMYELEVIAAVVVGGTSLMGGEGRMLGTLIGAFIIAVIRNGMNLLSVESSNQKIVLGAVLMISVLADRWKRR
jgi:ribose transport system permease protein